MQTLDTLKIFMEQKIPFNEFLNMKVDSLGIGEAIMRIPSRPELTGDPFRPALHGGVISTLADTAGGLAVFTKLEAHHTASTVDLRVDYLRPGDVTQDVIAKSTVIRVGNRVAATQTTVYQDDPDAPVAVAAAVYNVIRVKDSKSDKREALRS